MVSYADKLTPDETWDLVQFIRTMQTAQKSKEKTVLDAAGGPKALAASRP
jgi:hypothetical protein